MRQIKLKGKEKRGKKMFYIKENERNSKETNWLTL